MRHIQSPKPIFPVGLLLEGKRCLVVGGGRTAYHKALLLLEARASLRIVSPDGIAELPELAERPDVEWLKRPFEDADVDETVLAYAATNDRAANQHVLRVCRTAGISCCCVDRNWPQSDFITPATFRRGGLVVTVATGGRSCRHSRLVKDTLQRHIQLVETTDLLVMGTSHALLPIGQREPYHLSAHALNERGQLLSQIWGIHEFALLNTCNRIEILAAVAEETPVQSLIAMILGFDNLPADGYYVKHGDDAFEHTALLCAGLLSQTPGESNIVGQLKDAVECAAEQEWAGSIMTEWLDSALHISKHIRHSTSDQLQSREIDELCMAYLDDQRHELSDARALVVGAGTVGQRLVRQLVQRGAYCSWSYHINAPDLDESWRGRVSLCRMGNLAEALPRHDIVICAAAGDAPLITADDTGRLAADQALTLVDLAVPRNVSPDAVAGHRGITYLDLDDLKEWYRKEALDLDDIFETSRAITTDHADFYDKLIRSIQGGNS